MFVSTRAYRMKLKDWGFMRHKPRKHAASRDKDEKPDESQVEEEAMQDRHSSATVQPMSAEPMSADPSQAEQQSGWRIVSDVESVEAEPTFMGMLHQAPT
jgi:hypothetical protein